MYPMTSLPAAYRAVVPFKRLSLAKSRIALPAPDRAVLALAMARDTLAAVMASAGVASVTVVTDAEEYADTARGFGAAVLPDPGDLNLGLRQAAVGADRVVAILADLPALTPAGIAALLDSAESHIVDGEPCFVADASGTGTTAYLAPRGSFAPSFGPGSAARHREQGAVELPGRRSSELGESSRAWAGLRHDVDDLPSVVAAGRLGVGVHTRAALAALRLDEALDRDSLGRGPSRPAEPPS